MADPPRRRRPRSAEHGHDLVAVGGSVTRSPAPRHHPSRFPRHLHLERPGFLAYAGAPIRTAGTLATAFAAPFAAASVPLNRAHAADNRRRSDCASASTWSRSSPRSARALATNSSASRTRRSSVSRHPARSASRTASCSAVASPSASASTHRSNCQGATARAPLSDSHRLRPSGDLTEDAPCVLEEERATAPVLAPVAGPGR